MKINFHQAAGGALALAALVITALKMNNEGPHAPNGAQAAAMRAASHNSLTLDGADAALNVPRAEQEERRKERAVQGVNKRALSNVEAAFDRATQGIVFEGCDKLKKTICSPNYGVAQEALVRTTPENAKETAQYFAEGGEFEQFLTQQIADYVAQQQNLHNVSAGLRQTLQQSALIPGNPDLINVRLSAAKPESGAAFEIAIHGENDYFAKIEIDADGVVLLPENREAPGVSALGSHAQTVADSFRAALKSLPDEQYADATRPISFALPHSRDPFTPPAEMMRDYFRRSGP